MIGPENSHHFDYQSDSKLKPSDLVTCVFPPFRLFVFVFFVFYYEGGFLAMIGC